MIFIVVSGLCSFVFAKVSLPYNNPPYHFAHFALVSNLISDMIRIMREYGSEVSNQTIPQRKSPIQKASVVRQFRRWNPEFFRYFLHVNGEWVPKLGREGELRRRAEKRRELKHRAAKRK